MFSNSWDIGLSTAIGSGFSSDSCGNSANGSSSNMIKEKGGFEDEKSMSFRLQIRHRQPLVWQLGRLCVSIGKSLG